jgi:uncharacterized membrane protein YhhN
MSSNIMESIRGSAVATALTFACATSVSVLLIAEWTRRPTLKALAKTCASASFVAVGLCLVERTVTSDRWILIGLILGAVGDVALLGSGRRAFVAGLGTFLAGHLAYGVAFGSLVPPSHWLGVPALGVVAFGGSSLVWLLPHTGPLRVPVTLYIAVLCAMVVGALAVVGAGVSASSRIGAGAVLFAASDLAVARERFVSDSFVNKAWGLPIYYAGQLCFAWALSGATA